MSRKHTTLQFLEARQVLSAAIGHLDLVSDGHHSLVYDFAPVMSQAPGINPAYIDLHNLSTGALVGLQPSFSATDAPTIARFTFPNDNYSRLADGNYEGIIDGTVISGITDPIVVNDFVYAGDGNHDRAVNFADLVLLSQHYDQPGTYAQGDFDYSGTVDFADLTILGQKYNTSLLAPTSASYDFSLSSRPNADVTISWPSANVTADGFVFYRSDDNGLSYTAIKDITIADASLEGNPAALSFTDTTPDEGHAYSYRFRSYTVSGATKILSTATQSRTITTPLYAPAVTAAIRVDRLTAAVKIFGRSVVSGTTTVVATPVGGGASITLTAPEYRTDRLYYLNNLVQGTEYVIIATTTSDAGVSSTAGVGFLPGQPATGTDIGSGPRAPDPEPTTRPVLGPVIKLAPNTAEIITGPTTSSKADGIVVGARYDVQAFPFDFVIDHYRTEWVAAGPAVRIGAGQAATGSISWSNTTTNSLTIQYGADLGKIFTVKAMYGVTATSGTAAGIQTQFNIPADPKHRDIVILPVKEVLTRRYEEWYRGQIQRTSNRKLGGAEAGDLQAVDVSFSYLAYYE